MPTQIPANSTLFILRWSVAGDAEEMISTFGGSHDPSESADVVASNVYLAATSGSELTTVASMNAPWTFVGVNAYKRLGGDPVYGTRTDPITQTGGSQTSLPSNCALLVKKLTATAGRKGRGRMYIPPAIIDEGGVDTNGTIVGSTYSLINGRLAAFYAALMAYDIQPMLFHQDGAAPTAVLSFQLDTRIATQRRRMRR